MKKLTWLVVLVGVMAVAACGGSSSGGGASQAAKDAAEASSNSFGTLFDAAELQPCFEGTTQQCNCPGGGTVSTTVSAGGELTATFDSCKSADGKTFTGTVTGSETSETISANMSVFGDCTNATGSGPASACAGSISGTCAGESVTCTWSEVQQDGDTSCDLTC